MPTTPERYDNLVPGDKITIEYLVTKANPYSAEFTAGAGALVSMSTLEIARRNAVVTRAPREVKPGDTFYFENEFGRHMEKRTLVYRDEGGILFEYAFQRYWIYQSSIPKRGKLIYHDFG